MIVKVGKAEYDRMRDRGKRLALVAMLSNFAYDEFESFEVNRVGADLAYLMAAIAKGNKVEWEMAESKLLQALHANQNWRQSTLLWEHITILEPTEKSDG